MFFLMEALPKYAIIVAGGSGTRMNSEVPKQFILLNGLPILMHTVKNFFFYDSKITIILVLPSSQISAWNHLCQEHHFNFPLEIVHGGNTRFQSVKNGLAHIKEERGLVAIHDGVRPLIRKNIIQNAFKSAEIYGSGIVAVNSKDSLRVLKGNESEAVDRSLYKCIQTPQCFDLNLLKKAFDTEELPTFTDDATVFEHAGHKISLVEGGYENIKITTPEDLIIAEALLKNFC
ncbi:2-C-methyl-D-erythritol 4-phosphate cytidylyltransferase [Sporocytophaga myxococcoides]|uniref:2-C-methyl-D-erythritol 4-phosphate cytidylyltransferase n=2 Tax=Sporocytophaga myxococcoides TaxID=153721 RepID=A0A098L8A0_9BACT|nr:2-C-methyl-D-erythritol 4-phosphate cytidylyltransferase [Sporocytophaga myxococcoides]